MRLDEALRETGKATRSHVVGSRPMIVDRYFVTLIPTDFAIATDWLPYHDPPKEKRLREYGIGGTCATGRHSPHLMAWELPGEYDIIVREISPERDEIVRAGTAYVEEWRKNGAHCDVEIKLIKAVERWERAGRPA